MNILSSFPLALRPDCLCLCQYLFLDTDIIVDVSSRHPLSILNISEHFTRLRLQSRSNSPFGGYSSVSVRSLSLKGK